LVASEFFRGIFLSDTSKRVTLAGLGKLKPHDLRRTFATTMLANGCDVFVLQRAMGHASVTTISMYDYRSETQRKEICHALPIG
jgi:site-specific recombinase XerD